MPTDPKMPPRVIFRLTPYQARRLRKHFSWVQEQASAGRRGMLVAQIHGPRDTAYGEVTGKHPVARIGFVEYEQACLLEHKAKRGPAVGKNEGT